MCTIDAEIAEFCHLSMRKAKKQHTCNECKRNIIHGETYEYASGKWDGEIKVYKTCQHCLIAREWVDSDCEGWVFGEVKNDLCENIRYNHSLARIVVGMKRQWKRRDGKMMAIPNSPISTG